MEKSNNFSFLKDFQGFQFFHHLLPTTMYLGFNYLIMFHDNIFWNKIWRFCDGKNLNEFAANWKWWNQFSDQMGKKPLKPSLFIKLWGKRLHKSRNIAHVSQVRKRKFISSFIIWFSHVIPVHISVIVHIHIFLMIFQLLFLVIKSRYRW